MADLSRGNIGRWLAFSLALCICFSGLVNGDRITEKIYKKIDQGFSCFRRLNGTHQIGCSSSRTGNVGVVQLVENAADIDWVVDIGPHPPYVVLMWPEIFHRGNVIKLMNSGKVSGILVLNGTIASSPHIPSSYSNDLSCPNKFSGLYSRNLSSYCESKPWNPWGDGLLFEDINFPIFFIDETKFNQSVLLNECYFKFNQPQNGQPPNYPLCSIELKAFMWASVDTPTCLRRGRLNMLLNPQPSEYCDPLGSFNVFAPLLPVSKGQGDTKPRSVIMLAARMDSASLFDGLALGADTALTGAVTLMAVTDMLRQAQGDIQSAGLVDNILLTLFQGEAFDYIGSSRMVYDMMNNKFPNELNPQNPTQNPLIGLEHIKLFVELGSLAPHASSTVYTHSDPISISNSEVDEEVKNIVRLLKSNAENLNISEVDSSVPLPPSSFQSFLKKDIGIPGVVITNHETNFTNKYYNSEWDTPTFIKMDKLSQHLANVARTVSAAVYELSTNQPMPISIQPNISLVEKVLDCYMINGNCTLFNQLLNFKSSLYVAAPLTTYVGVQQSEDVYKPLIVRTRHLMALVSGQVVDLNRTSCFGNETDEIFHYYWMGESEQENITGRCYKSTVKTSAAVSPAFEVENYNWTSGEYSSWTESRWETFAMRIFLKPSPSQEWVVFSVGLVILLLSVVATYWLSSKADVLFPSNGSEGMC